MLTESDKSSCQNALNRYHNPDPRGEPDVLYLEVSSIRSSCVSIIKRILSRYASPDGNGCFLHDYMIEADNILTISLSSLQSINTKLDEALNGDAEFMMIIEPRFCWECARDLLLSHNAKRTLSGMMERRIPVIHRIRTESFTRGTPRYNVKYGVMATSASETSESVDSQSCDDNVSQVSDQIEL